MEQSYFNYNLKPGLAIDDFFVSTSNKKAYSFILNNKIDNKKILLIGPNKSGKTHLGKIWQKNNNAVSYENNFEIILNYKKNIFIDDFLKNINEEQIFHLINHCSINKLNILLTSNKELFEHNFLLKDLVSRLKTFNLLRINLPDDDLIINLIIKLLHDKQIIIKNKEIFHYILKRIERSYEDTFLLIENIDKLSLEKKRELTIPLIKKLL
jgi:chromosomal replication initiation ATPase DnaA